jgi:integrase/recombinase XerD
MTRGIKNDGNVEILCLPVESWPAQDRTLWEASLVESDPFGESGVRARLRPATNRAVVKGYGRWLLFLAAAGDLDADAAPASRITKDRVRSYIDALEHSGNYSSSIAARLEQLRAAAKIMDPTSALDWLKAPAARLRARATPKRDKRERLVSASELVTLGLDLMRDAPLAAKPGHQAVTYRDGLLIAFLALQPLRLKNLEGLVIGRTLIKENGHWVITFAASETKTHAIIEGEWPDVLTSHLEHYLTSIRPLLCRRRRTSEIAAGENLWVSAEGRPLSAKRINFAVKLRTQARFGRSINPHLFRDAAATTLATEDPLHVRAAAPLLGHRSLTTTETYYQQANTLHAQRAYAEGLRARLREE